MLYKSIHFQFFYYNLFNYLLIFYMRKLYYWLTICSQYIYNFFSILNIHMPSRQVLIMAHNYLRCYIGLPLIYLLFRYLESHQDIQMWFFIKSCNPLVSAEEPNISRSLVQPCTVWSGSAGRTRPELDFCVLIKELGCDLTHTLQLNTMCSSQQHRMQLSLCHFLLHHIHIQIGKHKYNEIYMCIHTNTHAHACHLWFHLKMDSGRVCCRRVCLWLCVRHWA